VSNSSDEDSRREEVFVKAIKSALLNLLGEPSAGVLEFHLEKRLRSEVYSTFYNDPSKFYNALRDFLGAGADGILRILAQKLSDMGYLESRNQDEFVELVKRGDEEAKQRLRKMFKLKRAEER